MNFDEAFTHFPVLTTNRIRLRQIQPIDEDAFFAIKSDHEVTEPYGQEPHKLREDTRAFIQRLQTSYDRRDAILWCITLK